LFYTIRVFCFLRGVEYKTTLFFGIENIKDLEDEFGPLIQEEYERRLSLAKSMPKRLHLSEENLISKVKKPFSQI